MTQSLSEQHAEQTLEALRKAVANALERKRRLGQYAVVWRDGRPVRLEPEELGGADDYGLGASAAASSVREPGPDVDGKNENGK